MKKEKISKIRKRDGRIVAFKEEKIGNAIKKAFLATLELPEKEIKERVKKLTSEVVFLLNKKFHPRSIPAVEEIQDIVEEVLMRNGFYRTARAYIIYREQHRVIREMEALIDPISLMESYLKLTDWRVRENSNMTFSLQGLNNYISSIVSSSYWLNKVYPKEVAQAHQNGDFHLHDLQLLSAYCCGWDLRDLLLLGFKGAPGKIESRPAKHFRAALGQVVNFFYTLQGEVAGAQAFSNFDTYLSPFIRYDGLSYKEVKQALQEFVYNVNIPTRVGFQTPFTNVTLDLNPPPIIRDENVIIGGEFQKEKYKDFQKEMDIFNQAFIEVLSEGDARGRPFSFPIPTYNITKDFNWEKESLKGLWEMTSKYGLPYFANFINSELKPEDVRSMCLDKEEEILIRNSKRIQRLNISKVAEDYKEGDFDQEGWAEPKKEKNLEVLSLNPETLKLEWVKILRFLKIKNSQGIEITTEDGKKATFSLKHPMAIYTPWGIKMKWAKEIKKGDYLLSFRNGKEILSKEDQKIGNLILDEDLAKILGYFVANGNYLFENRKESSYQGQPTGLQFTFKTGDLVNLKTIKSLIKKVFGKEEKEKRDPRFNTYNLYIYDTKISQKLFKAGFKKYGRLPQILFNSPPSVIKSFLNFYFKGDGDEKRKEIHLNDLELSRDLVLLFNLVGQPLIYRLKKKSQRIYLFQTKPKIKKNGQINNPILTERVPGWRAISTYKVPGLVKSRMVGFNTLEKYKESDIYLTRVKEIKIKNYRNPREFYDLELEKNHLFLHSLGQISFNCCRLRLDVRELRNKGGGFFAANPKTGSIGVVTINLPRIGYLSKDEKDYFKRLERLMEIAKISLEVKRKYIEKFTEAGLYPYCRFYLSDIKKAFGGYWKNHFSTIGIIGMNESCLNFLKKPIYHPQASRFTLKVLDFMREKLMDFQVETNNIYNLEATPAEGVSYRLPALDKAKYPKIITANEEAYKKGATPYYTNSTHLPVYYTSDLFEALKLQDKFQVKYTGGCIEQNAEVITNLGIMKIEDIVKNFKNLNGLEVISYNEKTGKTEWKPIEKAVYVDVQKTNKIKLEFEKNIEIITSDWHPFLVLEKVKINDNCPFCQQKIKNIKAWATHLKNNPFCSQQYKQMEKYKIGEKRADQLKVSDKILQVTNPTKIGVSGDKDLAWLTGFYLADGSCSQWIDNRGGNKLQKYTIRFKDETKETLEKALKILNKKFKTKILKLQKDKRSKNLILATSSEKVSSYFKQFGLGWEKGYTTCFSPELKSFDYQTSIALLSGIIDGDGYLNKQSDCEIYTTSYPLAKDIEALLYQLGINPWLSQKISKRQNETILYRLTISKNELIKIKDELEKYLVNPSKLRQLKNLPSSQRRRNPGVRVKSVSKINLTDDLFCDLMVKDNHNYLAGKGGFVFIHNTVLHGFLAEKLPNPEGTKKLVKKIAENFHLPYYTLTPTYSICPIHGYLPGEHQRCPKCKNGQECEVYSRVVGYFRPVSQWHEAKKSEFKDRLEYKIS